MKTPRPPQNGTPNGMPSIDNAEGTTMPPNFAAFERLSIAMNVTIKQLNRPNAVGSKQPTAGDFLHLVLTNQITIMSVMQEMQLMMESMMTEDTMAALSPSLALKL